MSRALELRDAFDRGFALAERPAAPAHRDFLSLRVGGAPVAIPLGDVASLHADLVIVPLPARGPELLGVAAIRAAIVPIYDLGAALGVAAAAAGATRWATRWAIVLRGGAAGFAFEAHDGHARIAEDAIAVATGRGHVRGQFQVDDEPRPIVDLAAVLAAIETRWRPTGTTGPAKEP
ncbi:MAG TPA: chemotaxis protein CheW [Kofleriaceae bacterium]